MENLWKKGTVKAVENSCALFDPKNSDDIEEFFRWFTSRRGPEPVENSEGRKARKMGQKTEKETKIDGKQPVSFDDENIFILQPRLNIYLKTQDLCILLGVTKQWIGQLVNQGTLIRTETEYGPMFSLMDSVKLYMDSLNEKVKKTADEKKLEKAKSAAEVKLKVAKAAMAELQAKELQGKMHRSEDTQVFTQGLIDMVKSSLLSLPGRLAVDLSLCDTAEECSILIRDEVRELLREISEFDYDPEKYEALVRERQNLDDKQDDEGDSE